MSANWPVSFNNELFVFFGNSGKRNAPLTLQVATYLPSYAPVIIVVNKPSYVTVGEDTF